MVSKVIFFVSLETNYPIFAQQQKKSLVNDKNKYGKLIFNKIEADQCHLQKVLLFV